MTYLLGINAYHGESSACIIRNGALVAAAEEERFLRVKHVTGFPSHAVRYCLSAAGVSLDQVAYVAVNQTRSRNDEGYPIAVRNDIRHELSAKVAWGKFTGEVHEVEHHFAHLSSAFHVSPFDNAVVVCVDGFGDPVSTAWGIGHGAAIAIDEEICFPHSLGVFFQAMTQWLGFPNDGDEYKVMGLAPYGQPKYLNEMRRLVSLRDDGRFELSLEYFRHHREQAACERERVRPLYSDALIGLLAPMRGQDEAISQLHMDIASSVQAMYEEALFHVLNASHARYRNDFLALAGGCALNSAANGKIYRKTPFKKIYVPAAPGDAGVAVGAAFAVWHKLGGKRGFAMNHAFWGPHFGNAELGALLENARTALAAKGCTAERVADQAELCRRTARAIADGKVIGWFQGRMEWGPRALGNRSILGDPRRADMKDILNLKIKRRESFRPFAPSILREAVPQWFETDDEVPFMTQVYQVREEKRAAIPAVTHVDGSGRLQTVRRETNPCYYALIEEFQRITGVPLVLNTSFNENEPVACRPEQALDCFLRTEMDALVLGEWFVERAVQFA